MQVADLADYAYKRDHPEARGHLHPPSRKKLSWLYFLTGNASVRRDDLLRAGCFDENFTGYGHEDLELGYRLQRDGVEILYEPRAVNYHCQAVGYEDQKEKMRLAGRSTARFYRKHPRFRGHAEVGNDAAFARRALAAFALAAPAWASSTGRRGTSRLARELLLQYYYVSGIKEARDGR